MIRFFLKENGLRWIFTITYYIHKYILGKSTFINGLLESFKKCTNIESLKEENPSLRFEVLLFYDSRETVDLCRKACKKAELKFTPYNVLVDIKRLSELHMNDSSLWSLLIFEVWDDNFFLDKYTYSRICKNTLLLFQIKKYRSGRVSF